VHLKSTPSVSPSHAAGMSSGRGRTRRAARWLALTAAVATALVGCSALGSDTSNPSSAAGPLEKAKIKVAILPTIDVSPLWLAQEAGYFKAEGLDVETVVVDSGQKALDKAISGEADIASSSYMPFFVAKATGVADMKLVAAAGAVKPKSFAIVATPNSPVKTLKDLAGKRIAMTARNTATDLLTKSLMKDHGVDFDQVKWVQVQFPNVVAALATGRDIDAALLPEPYITQAAKLAGAIPIVDVNTGATEGFPLSGYGAISKWVQANPKTLAAFQRALRKAASVANDDRSKIEPLLVKYAKVDEDTSRLVNFPDFGSALDARPLQRVPDLMLQMGALTTKLDVTSMIAPQATR